MEARDDGGLGSDGSGGGGETWSYNERGPRKEPVTLADEFDILYDSRK